MKILNLRALTLICAVFGLMVTASNSALGRARDLGIPLLGKPGPNNAITDVPGVEVGSVTLVQGNKVRTGVTAILPQGKKTSRVPGAWFSMNGNGELTGTAWIDEMGILDGPILWTNTYSVGVVRDAVRQWGKKRFPHGNPEDLSGDDPFSLPVVGETWDGYLNDINGFHIRKEHAFAALDHAASGPVAEGSVGGGTGSVCFQFKCGTGTASRLVSVGSKTYTVGVIVQANFGKRNELVVAGVPVGTKVQDLMPELHSPGDSGDKDGSILVAIATDAPMLPGQLKRLAKRAAMGIARTGGVARNSSGDLFIAFSTQSPKRDAGTAIEIWSTISGDVIDDWFTATIQATEESILNALVAGKTMQGVDGNKIYAIPHDRLVKLVSPVLPVLNSK